MKTITATRKCMLTLEVEGEPLHICYLRPRADALKSVEGLGRRLASMETAPAAITDAIAFVAQHIVSVRDDDDRNVEFDGHGSWDAAADKAALVNEYSWILFWPVVGEIAVRAAEAFELAAKKHAPRRTAAQ